MSYVAPLRWRNAVLLHKIETTPGTDPTPTAGSNAVLVENVTVKPTVNVIQTQEVTGSLDPRGPLIGGIKYDLGFKVYLKGNGTAGGAPEFASLLKVCGMIETLTAAAVPSSAEACGADGSTTTATLGTGASSTLEAYRYMPIAFTGDVVATSFISDYAAAKLATLTDTLSAPTTTAATTYQILKNALYVPGTGSSGSPIPNGTAWFYVDGLRYRFTGCTGTFTITMDTGGTAALQFNLTGQFEDLTDQAIVTPTYDTTRPAVIKNGVFLLDRLAFAHKQLTLDPGNVIAYPDNANALEGYDPGVITGRMAKGTVDPLETTVATRDTMTKLRAGTAMLLHGRFGATAGQRVAVTSAQIILTSRDPDQREGLATTKLPFQMVGQNSTFGLCFW